MSSTWNNVVKELETQQITTLKPVTQGIIINVTCISSIEKLRSGLYSITLVNLPNLPVEEHKDDIIIYQSVN